MKSLIESNQDQLTSLSPGGTRRTYISELDIVRAFAILAVLSVHATSFATIEMADKALSTYYAYNFFNSFMKFGTPIFIFLSSFVLHLSYSPGHKSFNLTPFYKRRLQYIIIPYVMFSIIYNTAVNLFRPRTEFSIAFVFDFVEKLFTGTAYAHLYFIFVNIQFYLLFPAVLWLFRSFPRLVPWAIPIGFIVQWGFHGIGMLVEIPRVGSWAFSYFIYYMTGVFFGLKYQYLSHIWHHQCKPFARRLCSVLLWTGWAVTGLGHVQVWFMLRKHDVVASIQAFQFLWSLYAFFSAVVLLQAAFYLNKRFFQSPMTSFLQHLGVCSFGVYLLHPLLLALYREFRPDNAGTILLHLWYVGGFLFAWFGAWAVVFFSNKYFKFAWIFFGAIRKR